jgi:AmmeMemoRadiSam system protein B
MYMVSGYQIRPSPIAGRWYSGDALRLASEVDGYIDQAILPKLSGSVVGIMAPHAGYQYSGKTAGYAFRCVQDITFELVVILSPFHARQCYELLTTGHAAYQTPLGIVEVDRESLERLSETLKKDGVDLGRVVFDEEHSLEIELPFLQRALRGVFYMLPLMVAIRNEAVLQLLGEGLAEIVRERNVLLVASTDLSHFYPLHIAQKLDEAIMEQVAAFSPSGILEAEEHGKGFACGAGAVAAMLWAAKALGANEVNRLHYSTSGEITGDNSAVVGYGAAVVLKTES